MCFVGFDEDTTALHEVDVPTIEIEPERSSLAQMVVLFDDLVHPL